MFNPHLPIKEASEKGSFRWDVVQAQAPVNNHPDIPGVTFGNPGEGLLGPLVRAHDWSQTPLGPMAQWPQALRGYVAMVLALPGPAIIFWGPEQRQIYNDGYSVIMGPRHPRYLGASYRDCWPDTYPTIFPWMQRVLQGEVVEVARTLIPVTRHGFEEEAFFTFTFSPLRDDQGQIAGILQLVTEETSAVLAARREATLRALSPFPITEVRGSARVLSALATNPSCLPVTCYWAADEVGGTLKLQGATGLEPSDPLASLQGLAEEVFRENRPRELDPLQSLLPGLVAPPWPEPITRAVLLPIHRDPSEPARGVVLLAISPRLRLDDAYRDFLRRVSVEIAAFGAAEQELLLAEQLSLALDSARMGTWRIDLVSRRILLLDRTAALLGLKGPVEQDLDEINRQRVHPDDLPGLEQALRTAIDQNLLYSFEYRVRTESQQLRWLRSWGRPTYAPDGTPLAVPGVSLDVTEQVEGRQRIEKLVTELADSVRARDEFISIASHELKTPLSSLKLQTQGFQRALARKDPAALQPERVERLVEQTDRQTRRLNRLVDDMLDVSRIATGKLSMIRTTLDLAPLIFDLQERLSWEFRAAETALEVRCQGSFRVMGDPDRLEQVLVNLLSNALRYGHGSPVLLSVETRDEWVRVAVEDRGLGIATQDRLRVFERFERGVSANEASGLGLGLFIAREIVHAHGGRIWVDDAHQPGTRFVFELPRD